ncbi:beta-L-arabinofuranosidase domain-containing protein [Bifidobacterium catulorum]|nr:beta-L-arabinofuranosidase domain-containing protein [Bifidobacterium catulorum]
MVAAFALTVSVVPASAAPDENPLTGSQIQSLAFDGNLDDASGNRLGGTVSSGTPSYVEGKSGQALNLTGNQHVSLGTDSRLQPAALTLSFWIKPNATMNGEQVISWAKAKYTDAGWYLSSTKDHALVFSVTDSKGTLGEFYANTNRADLLPAGQWTHIAVSYDGSKHAAVFYKNGLRITDTSTGRNAAAVGPIASSDVEKGIGWNGPAYKQNSLNAALDDYQLYSAFATADQIRTIYDAYGTPVTDQQIVAADAATLAVPGTMFDITPLPLTGPNGSKIVWTSSDPSALAVDSATGMATPQKPAKDTAVKLTAAVSHGEATTSRDFNTSVMGTNETTAQVPNLKNDLASITLDDSWLANGEEKNTEFLLKLDPQRFLYNFYQTAGLPQPQGNKSYANSWEQNSDQHSGGTFRGHATGHYLSSLSQAYVAEKDPAVKAQLLAKANELLTGFKKCQDAWDAKHPNDKGYLSAFQEAFLRDLDGLGRVDQRIGTVYQPYYALHKVVAGLVDAANLLPPPRSGR